MDFSAADTLAIRGYNCVCIDLLPLPNVFVKHLNPATYMLNVFYLLLSPVIMHELQEIAGPLARNAPRSVAYLFRSVFDRSFRCR